MKNNQRKNEQAIVICAAVCFKYLLQKGQVMKHGYE